jgi:hypothetical protein
MTDVVAKIGGIFAVFTFIDFFVDWVFQNHSEAMVKHNNSKIRAKHCVIYITGFVPNVIDEKAGFIQFISTPLGKILMITIDQIIHLSFLFPVIWMAVN